MSRLLIFLASLSLLTLTMAVSPRVIEGTWMLASSASYSFCPKIFPFFKIAVTNQTSGETNFSSWSEWEQKMYSGSCKIQNSSLSCGILQTNLTCDTSTNYIFNSSDGNLRISWDTLYSQYMYFAINYTIYGFPQTCAYEFNKLGVNFNPVKGDWRVKTCSCSSSCCYALGSSINLNPIDDYHNKPHASLSGTLSGDWCENNLASSDDCYLNTTSTSSSDNKTFFKMHCTTMSCRDYHDAYFGLSYNETSTGLLKWNSGLCSADLVLKGSQADKNNSAGRLAWFIALMILALLFN